MRDSARRIIKLNAALKSIVDTTLNLNDALDIIFETRTIMPTTLSIIHLHRESVGKMGRVAVMDPKEQIAACSGCQNGIIKEQVITQKENERAQTNGNASKHRGYVNWDHQYHLKRYTDHN